MDDNIGTREWRQKREEAWEGVPGLEANANRRPMNAPKGTP